MCPRVRMSTEGGHVPSLAFDSNPTHCSYCSSKSPRCCVGAEPAVPHLYRVGVDVSLPSGSGVSTPFRVESLAVYQFVELSKTIKPVSIQELL